MSPRQGVTKGKMQLGPPEKPDGRAQGRAWSRTRMVPLILATKQAHSSLSKN